jgi:hypothetical protein
MPENPDDLVVNLCRRIEALEAVVAAQGRTTFQPRPASRFAQACVVLLMGLGGWAVAQTPGQAPNATAIQQGPDGITRVRGPLQVMDPGGKILLSVASDPNPSAAVSVAVQGDGGVVAAYTGGGTLLAFMARNTAGYGTFVAYDGKGTPRAVIHGGSGGFQALNEAGKQVAYLTSIGGKGVVGVWGAGEQRIAALTEGPTGAGEVTVYDKDRSTLATMTSHSAGGVVHLFGRGKTAPAVDVSINAAGAGNMVLLDGGGKTAATVTGAADDGNGAIVIQKGGRSIASLSINKVGGGDLILNNSEGRFGLEAVGASESTPGRGGVVAVFNKSGDQVAAMGTLDDGSGILTVQEKGKPLVEVTRDAGTRAGRIVLNGPEGKTGVEVMGGTGSGGGILVSNKNGDSVATVESTAQGKGSITIVESDRAVAELTADATSAGKMILKNHDGKTLVEASTTAADGGRMVVSSSTGDPVATLRADKNKGAVSILNKNDEVAVLRAAADGTGYLYLTDAQGKVGVDAEGASGSFTAFHKEQVVATVGSTEGRGRIAAYSKGKPIAEMAENASGAGIVFVRSPTNVAIAGMSGGGPNVSAAVVLRNSAGNTVAEMSTGEQGRGQVKVSDATGAPLAVMAQAPDRPGGAFEVYSKGLALVNIRPGAAGGGYIQLLNASGTPAVEVGVDPAGFGVVRAGPNFKCGSNYLGLKVPDCIVGIK